MRHGSINVDPANTGLRTTDGTQHYEQDLHLKFAGRKRRRDVSPTDSKSRQIVLHTPTNDRRRVSCASESPTSCLRCSFNCAGRTDQLLCSRGWALLLLSFFGDPAGRSLPVSPRLCPVLLFFFSYTLLCLSAPEPGVETLARTPLWRAPSSLV